MHETHLALYGPNARPSLQIYPPHNTQPQHIPNAVQTQSKHNPNAVQTQSKHNPNAIQTQSRHNPDTIQTQSKHNPNTILTQSKRCPNTIQTQSKHNPNKLWHGFEPYGAYFGSCMPFSQCIATLRLHALQQTLLLSLTAPLCWPWLIAVQLPRHALCAAGPGVPWPGLSWAGPSLVEWQGPPHQSPRRCRPWPHAGPHGVARH